MQKNNQLKIGFDFDGIFVDAPPLIPTKFIEFLYKGKLKSLDKSDLKLKYRIPGSAEKRIRVFSHNIIFRPPIKNNIRSLKLINKKTNHKIYLVSSRFGFLKEKTNIWMDKHKMKKEFNEIYFNFNNMQPHLFKEKIIKKNNITHYIDDDLDLLVYLSKKIPDNTYLWISRNKRGSYKNLPENIKMIKNIRELYTKYL